MFYKLSIFWTAIRFSENLNVRAGKCRSDAKHPESRQKQKFYRSVAVVCKFRIFCLVVGFRCLDVYRTSSKMKL